LFFAGLGTAATARDTVRDRLERLVDEGRLTAEEARAVWLDAGRDGEREWEELRRTARDAARRLLEEMDIATGGRVAELEGRVAELEGRADALTAARDDLAGRVEALEKRLAPAGANSDAKPGAGGESA
jgi:polyhydroxyalkanoate synthesis regulator phasin